MEVLLDLKAASLTINIGLAMSKVYQDLEGLLKDHSLNLRLTCFSELLNLNQGKRYYLCQNLMPTWKFTKLGNFVGDTFLDSLLDLLGQ